MCGEKYYKSNDLSQSNLCSMPSFLSQISCILSDLNVPSEQAENENPAHKSMVSTWWFLIFIYIFFFFLLNEQETVAYWLSLFKVSLITWFDSSKVLKLSAAIYLHPICLKNAGIGKGFLCLASGHQCSWEHCNTDCAGWEHCMGARWG